MRKAHVRVERNVDRVIATINGKLDSLTWKTKTMLANVDCTWPRLHQRIRFDGGRECGAMRSDSKKQKKKKMYVERRQCFILEHGILGDSCFAKRLAAICFIAEGRILDRSIVLTPASTSLL